MLSIDQAKEIGGLLATAAPVGVALRWAVPRVKRGYRLASDFFVRVNVGLTTVDKIAAALGPNGGKSLADGVARLERAAIVRDARAAALILASPVPIWEADSHGRIVAINRAFEDLIGAPPSEVLGHEWISLLLPECRRRVVDEWRFAVKDQRRFSSEAALACDGKVVELLLVADPMRTVAGEVVGWHGTARVRP
jgi:PAS domain S-box-containing protein